MTDRGESSFIHFPKFAATMYDYLMGSSATKRQYEEIALYLSSILDQGRLLDVGTGPGRMLASLHSINPQIELFGLDISEAMVQRAQKNLDGIEVDLRVGNIKSTDFETDFFDVVTCTGSFYLWNHPVESLDEIHRILKPSASTVLFETYSDHDPERFEEALKDNLREESFFRRKTSPRFLRQQIKMTYTRNEVREIIEQTKFSDNYQIHEVTIASLPIWLRIELTKGQSFIEF